MKPVAPVVAKKPLPVLPSLTVKAPAVVAPVEPVEPDETPEPEPGPTLADALASVTDPTLHAMLSAALAERDALIAGRGTVPDPKIPPPLMFWLSADRKTGYVASAWKPSDAFLGAQQDPETNTVRGAIRDQAGGKYAELPSRNGRRWGYWHGKAAPLNAACKLLMAVGWRVIHVASLADAETRADAELAKAPMVPAPPRSKKGGTVKASTLDANAPLDLTGFEA